MHALAIAKNRILEDTDPSFSNTGHAKHPSPLSLLKLYLVHRPLKESEETGLFPSPVCVPLA